MYVHQRRDRNGREYYSFSYVDEEGKRVRLKKDEHPHFATRAEAEAWAASQEATRASRRSHHLRKLAWRSQYYDFETLLAEKYSPWIRKRAPNSYRSCESYLRLWVFPYFLGVRQMGNVNDWHLEFQGFLDWLQSPDAGRRRGRTQPIAASTVNNIVKALNGFIECLRRYNLVDPASAIKCPTLPEHELNRRDASDVISEDEMRRVRARLSTIHPPAADFFFVLWHTGMRFSELFGLPFSALFRGEAPEGPLRAELAKCGISCVGYLYLDSQPLHDDRRREEDGSIARKPLKSMKRIDAKYARVIPIRTREVWNILAARYLARERDYAERKWGADRANYPLFEDLEWNKAVNSLKEAYIGLKMEPRGYHACRHSFTTQLVGETRSFFLVRAITGHRKDKSFERYLHIYEQLAIEAKQKEQTISLLPDDEAS